MDFQIVLPIKPEIAHGIIWNLVEQINNSRTFKDGELVEGIIQNYPIKLKKAKEVEREVLRIILPDEKSLFYGDDGCSPLYAYQEFANVNE